MFNAKLPEFRGRSPPRFVLFSPLLRCDDGYDDDDDAPLPSREVALTLDGARVPVARAYNSRGLAHAECFLGFYYDASALLLLDDDDGGATAAAHELSLALPPGLGAGRFQGAFWENVETEYSERVAACSFAPLGDGV